MQILIIGKGAKEYTLAKKIKEQNPESIIFVAPGNQAIANFATCIDIQMSNVKELVEFAEANEISLTIVTDETAIKSSITDAFNEAGLMIFAPDKEAARIATNKTIGKRFMYKLNIPTQKFGIFDKEQAAREYIKTADFPIIIKYDEHIDGERNFLCCSTREANKILNKIYATECPKIVIENYVSGREFSFYAITDGYNALSVMSVVPYKFASEKDGGSITPGVGAYAPATFVDEELQNRILDTIIYPALAEIASNSEPYVGVLGVDLILDNSNNLWAMEFNTFFNEPDTECVTELLEDNIIDLFRACCVGSLADDYPELFIFPGFALSVVLTKTPEYLFDNRNAEVIGIENLEEMGDAGSITLYNAINKKNIIRAKHGRILSLTSTAPTLTKAKKMLFEDIQLIDFKGKKYRKDILEPSYEH